MKVRLGIIGIGSQGTTYSIALAKNELRGNAIEPFRGLELTAVCDTDIERRQWANDTLENVAVFDNYQDLLSSGLVDAVMVVTPHYLHPEIAIKAMEQGLHVLVDKPAGVYTKQVREMNEAAERHPDLVFALMFNQRTNPLYQKVKELIDGGAIGSIRRTNWLITNWWRPQAYYDMSEWRATWAGEGGGVLINQAPHQIDLWQWLCGMPKSVYAKATFGGYRDISVEDDVTAVVEYENGATGVFVTCTHDIVGTDRFEIHGETGKLIIEDSSKLSITITTPEGEVNRVATEEQVRSMMSGNGIGIELIKEASEHTLGNEWGIQHLEVMNNFADAILNGAELLAPGHEGINALEITNAMHLSSWLGQEVSLPIDEDLFLAKLEEKIAQEGQ